MLGKAFAVITSCKMNKLVFSVFYALIFISKPKLISGSDYDDDDNDGPFLEPYEMSDMEDSFVRGEYEYIFVNFPMEYDMALYNCEINYGGRLAHVYTYELAKFLADALSETNLIVDALWVSARRSNQVWYWYDKGQKVKPVSKEIMNIFVDYNNTIEQDDRDCLTLARNYHNYPHFPYYQCNVSRPMVCERDASNGGGNGSTHPGWIKLGERLYKIFRGRLNWEDSQANCIICDRLSRLAVVVNNSDAQALGRYLLVGRPSLENAWIGSSFVDHNYIFKQENIILSNVTDRAGYPPWRNGTVQKIGGCLLLDRHLSNVTYFIEARCFRLRPYICYKKESDVNPKKHKMDILIEEFGYRIYFFGKAWENAKNKCDSFKEKYDGKLAEIRERRIVNHLLYVMGENKTASRHIWLGGKYIDGNWTWGSNKSLINLELLNWIHNMTYVDDVERYNECLNMDRENHLVAMHYGARCVFRQAYVCMFPREKLVQLQKDEAEAEAEKSSKKKGD